MEATRVPPSKAKQRKQRPHRKPDDATQKSTTTEKAKSMTWAQRLKRVFRIDI